MDSTTTTPDRATLRRQQERNAFLRPHLERRLQEMNAQYQEEMAENAERAQRRVAFVEHEVVEEQESVRDNSRAREGDMGARFFEIRDQLRGELHELRTANQSLQEMIGAERTNANQYARFTAMALVDNGFLRSRLLEVQQQREQAESEVANIRQELNGVRARVRRERPLVLAGIRNRREFLSRQYQQSVASGIFPGMSFEKLVAKPDVKADITIFTAGRMLDEERAVFHDVYLLPVDRVERLGSMPHGEAHEVINMMAMIQGIAPAKAANTQQWISRFENLFADLQEEGGRLTGDYEYGFITATWSNWREGKTILIGLKASYDRIMRA